MSAIGQTDPLAEIASNLGATCLIVGENLPSIREPNAPRSPHFVYLAQKGLAFRSNRSMCVVVARVTVPRAATVRPDVLIRPGLVSVRGLD